MKTKHLAGILSLFLCTIFLISCNNDDKLAPITLGYEGSQYQFSGTIYGLTPFSKETDPLSIKGGDGNYKVTNDNEEVVRLKFDGKKISLKPLKLGEAIITIEDGSGNVCTLPITISYHKLVHEVSIVNIIVKGDNITAEDKIKLGREMTASYPNSVYRFTFKNAEDSKGTALFSYENGEEKEYEFELEQVLLDEEDAILINERYKLNQYSRVTIKDDNGDAIDTFYITKDFSFLLKAETRMNSAPMPRYCLIRDLTEQYQETYPQMEHAYLIQVIQ